jgi:hypothetical protein
MINLHERLSEFSYGYGVTRDVEALFASAGLKTTPFLPSLLHEKDLGFDVAFSGSGTVVMLQFKLGEELSRFRRTSPAQTIPKLGRPFWRFVIDTSEHQFRRLYQFESTGAQVFYVAPRFSSWSQYEQAFHNNKVLDRSLLITPTELRAATHAVAAKHRVVYDRSRRYVCSEPTPIEEIRPEVLLERVNTKARDTQFSLEMRLKLLLSAEGPERELPKLPPNQRERIEGIAGRPSDALAALVGLEAWLQGAQPLFVTPT